MEFAANLKENILDFHSMVDHGFPKENSYNNSANNLKFPVFDPFFTIEGSSSNPFSKLVYASPSPFYDPFQASANSAAASAANYIHFSNELSNGEIQFLHGDGLNFPPNNYSKAASISDQYFQGMEMHDQNSQPLINFQGIDSSTDSCITADKGHDDDHNDKMQMKRKHKAAASSTKFNAIKGQWSREEDRLLVELVEQHGNKKWCYIAKMLPGRLGKQCRERWHNHLRPNIKKDAWSEEEDILLIEAHKKMGNRWAEIAKKLPGRSENTIKNHWNATKRRQLSSFRNNGTNPKYNTLLQKYIQATVLSTSQEEDNTVNSNTTTANVIVEGSSSEFGPQQVVHPTNYGYGNDDRNGMGRLDMNFGAKMWADVLDFGTSDVNLECDQFQQQPPHLQVPLMEDEFDMGKDMSFLEMLFQW